MCRIRWGARLERVDRLSLRKRGGSGLIGRCATSPRSGSARWSKSGAEGAALRNTAVRCRPWRQHVLLTGPAARQELADQGLPERVRGPGAAPDRGHKTAWSTCRNRRPRRRAPERSSSSATTCVRRGRAGYKALNRSSTARSPRPRTTCCIYATSNRRHLLPEYMKKTSRTSTPRTARSIRRCDREKIRSPSASACGELLSFQPGRVPGDRRRLAALVRGRREAIAAARQEALVGPRRGSRSAGFAFQFARTTPEGITRDQAARRSAGGRRRRWRTDRHCRRFLSLPSRRQVYAATGSFRAASSRPASRRVALSASCTRSSASPSAPPSRGT